MFEQRKGKDSAPGHRIPEFITVKDPYLAQPIKYAHVECLTNDEQCSPEPQRPHAATQRPERALTIHRAPTDKHRALDDFRRFLKKNLPFQGVGAGLIKISYLGNAGWRSNRASTACIAAFPSTMPFWYTLRLSSTTG